MPTKRTDAKAEGTWPDLSDTANYDDLSAEDVEAEIQAIAAQREQLELEQRQLFAVYEAKIVARREQEQRERAEAEANDPELRRARLQRDMDRLAAEIAALEPKKDGE